MQRAFRSTLAGAGLLSVAACGPTIRADRDESIPVPQGSTWAWDAGETGHDTGAAYRRDASPVGEIVQQRFKRAIEATMLAKGYRQVSDTGQADFVLGYRFGERPLGRGAGAVVHPYGPVIGIGVAGGWGYHPWGFGRFGFYRPWGFYQPWSWGFFGAPMWGAFVAPAYPVGYRVYSDGALVVVLRHRPTGYVAWSGRLGSDALYSHRLSQERVQRIVDKLLRNLR